MEFPAWPGLSLRPITAADEPVLYAIYASTREEELRPLGWPSEQMEAFLRGQFHAQHHWYQTHYQSGSFDLILEHGQTVGRLYVYRQPHDLNVIDISLLPAHRGRGLGTFLMRQLLAEADGAGQRVSLHVEVFNRARTLYDRLGFRPVGEAGVHVEMHRAPMAGETSSPPATPVPPVCQP